MHRTLIEHCGNSNVSPIGIVEQALLNSRELKRRKKITPFAKVFCIFDVDLNQQTQNVHNRQTQINQALSIAKRHNIVIILNNSCIERWFLFHFIDSTAQWNPKESLKQMQNVFNTYGKNSDFSEKQILLNKLLNPKNYKIACNFVKRNLNKFHNISSNNTCYNIKNNPYSNMYELLEELMLTKTNIKER